MITFSRIAEVASRQKPACMDLVVLFRVSRFLALLPLLMALSATYCRMEPEAHADELADAAWSNSLRSAIPAKERGQSDSYASVRTGAAGNFPTQACAGFARQ